MGIRHREAEGRALRAGGTAPANSRHPAREPPPPPQVSAQTAPLQRGLLLTAMRELHPGLPTSKRLILLLALLTILLVCLLFISLPGSPRAWTMSVLFTALSQSLAQYT